MLTIEECLEEAKRNLALAKPINLRNAGRCLADYARIVFAEIGQNYPAFLVVKEQSIKNKYKLLSPLFPELVEYEPFFLGIDSLRNSTEHGEVRPPESTLISRLITDATNFQPIFNDKIMPKARAKRTPREKFEEEWKLIGPMLQSLEQYANWRFITYDQLKPEIERLEGIFLESDAISDEVIHEARIDLKDLTYRIQELIQEGELTLMDNLADSDPR